MNPGTRLFSFQQTPYYRNNHFYFSSFSQYCKQKFIKKNKGSTHKVLPLFKYLEL